MSRTTIVADAWQAVYPCTVSDPLTDDEANATEAAAAILFAASGGRYGVYRTADEQYRVASCAGRLIGAPWLPYQAPDGGWLNLRCDGSSKCVLVPRRGPVRSVEALTVNGATTTDFTITDGGAIEIGGVCPACNPDSTAAAITLTYEWGVTPGALGGMALGEVACEVLAGWRGDTCRLSGRASTVTRQGVTVEIEDATELLDAGLVGTPVADSWIRVVNPHRLRSAPRVVSPDLPRV